MEWHSWFLAGSELRPKTIKAGGAKTTGLSLAMSNMTEIFFSKFRHHGCSESMVLVLWWMFVYVRSRGLFVMREHMQYSAHMNINIHRRGHTHVYQSLQQIWRTPWEKGFAGHGGMHACTHTHRVCLPSAPLSNNRKLKGVFLESSWAFSPSSNPNC